MAVLFCLPAFVSSQTKPVPKRPPLPSNAIPMYPGVKPVPQDTTPGPQVIRQEIQVRKVWPLFYRGGVIRGKKFCDGGSNPMIVRVQPSRVKDVRVGFFESEFFGAGPQWRASGWMAVVVSAFLTGQPMARWRISFDAAGKIDGPSAGGLMTATVLSAIRRDKILPHVTMTGTINPDGSIGPVGGIYYKIIGAKRVGKTTVLIPVGKTHEKPCGSAVPKSLVERGAQLGVRVIPVGTIYEAYKHLTGKDLPRPKDTGQKFALPPKTIASLKNSYARWQRTFNDRIARMRHTARRIPQKFRPILAGLWRRAYDRRNRGIQAFKRGQIPAAVGYMWNGTVIADVGAHVSYLLVGYKKGGIRGMMGAYMKMRVGQKFLDQFLDQKQD